MRTGLFGCMALDSGSVAHAEGQQLALIGELSQQRRRTRSDPGQAVARNFKS